MLPSLIANVNKLCSSQNALSSVILVLQCRQNSLIRTKELRVLVHGLVDWRLDDACFSKGNCLLCWAA